MQTVANSLCDYFETESVNITEINSQMLSRYEAYLRIERKLVRKNQFGKL